MKSILYIQTHTLLSEFGINITAISSSLEILDIV